MDKIAPDFYRVDFSDITLPMIVVTRGTKDYPDKVVGRLWDGATSRPTNLVVLRDTLDGLRQTIPPNFVRLDRAPKDDPVIVETWL